MGCYLCMLLKFSQILAKTTTTCHLLSQKHYRKCHVHINNVIVLTKTLPFMSLNVI